jgi:hypothetical protein
MPNTFSLLFISSLIKKSFQQLTVYSVELNGDISKYELERMWKEVVVA